MKQILLLTIAFMVYGQLGVQAADYDSIKQQAERAYNEGSYKRAQELYAQLNRDQLKAEERRWTELRLADTALRSEASSQQTDDSASQKAQSELRKFLQQDSLHDQIWAEANESLADYHWYYPRQRDWGQGWGYYEKALEYWAGSTNLNLAGERYLQIV